jgi:hypothetical protein
MAPSNVRSEDEPGAVERLVGAGEERVDPILLLAFKERDLLVCGSLGVPENTRVSGKRCVVLGPEVPEGHRHVPPEYGLKGRQRPVVVEFFQQDATLLSRGTPLRRGPLEIARGFDLVAGH